MIGNHRRYLFIFISLQILFLQASQAGILPFSFWKRPNLKPIQISAGQDHTCALFDNYKIKCWGANAFGQLGYENTTALGDGPGEMGNALPFVDLGSGRTATQVVAGALVTCALLDGGDVKCWGGNSVGQLGQGNVFTLGDGASEMGDLLPVVDLGLGRTAVYISFDGGNNACAILDNGSAKCWGFNTQGQLGLGATDHRGDGANEMGSFLPAIGLGTNRTAIGISASQSVCALLDNSSVKCWGRGDHGELGYGNTNNLGDGVGEMDDSLPTVDLGTNRTALNVQNKSFVSCARLDDSTLKCWGYNGFGILGKGNANQLGDNGGEMGDSLLAMDFGSSRTVTQFSLGTLFACAILSDSSVKCWGRNTYGGLGLGDASNRGDDAGEMGNSLPAINLGTGRKAIKISAGTSHVCVILDDSSVKCWGQNSTGQLGLGDTSHRGDGAGEMGDSLPKINLGTKP